MALTIAVTRSELMGRRRVKLGTVTFDSSYLTGGEAFDPNDIGLTTLDWISFNQGEDGYVAHYDHANSKILLFESGTASAGLDEQDSTNDMSAVVIEFFAVGK